MPSSQTPISMAGLDVRLLGPPEVTVDGKPFSVDTRKAVALLAYLSVEKPVVSREMIAGFLWPEQSEQSARGALRRTLSVLRKASRGRVSADRNTIDLDLPTKGDIDVHRFLELSRPATSHGHAANNSCDQCVDALEQAAALVKGDFMEGFVLRDCPPFEMWQLQWAERLRIQLDDCLRRLSAAYAASTDYWRAISTTRRRVEANPLNEDAWCELMQLNAWSGNSSAAIGVYRECVVVLDRELGVPPLETTTDLMEAIAEGDLKPAPSERRHSPSRPAADTVHQILESASVVSEPFTAGLLRDVSGRTKTEADSAVDALLSEGTLTEGTSGTLSFTDAHHRDRVYTDVPLSRRRLLHGRAADALLVRAHPDQVIETAQQLEKAGRVDEAAEWRVSAAESSLTHHRLDEALAHFDTALALGHSAPPIHESMGDIHRLAGRYGDALAAYQRAAGSTESSAIEGKIGSLFARVGRYELAKHHLLLALEDPHLSNRSRVLIDLGLVGVRQGSPEEGERRADEARQHAADDLRTLAHAENLLGVAATRDNRPDDGLRHLEQASRLAGRISDAALVAAVANNLGLALAALGRFEDAAVIANRAVKLAIEVGDRHGEAAARSNLADHLRRSGRAKEADAEVSRGVEIMAEIGIEPEKLDPEIWKLTDW